MVKPGKNRPSFGHVTGFGGCLSQPENQDKVERSGILKGAVASTMIFKFKKIPNFKSRPSDKTEIAFAFLLPRLLATAQKYAFLRPEETLKMNELHLDQAPQDIITEEFQLKSVRLQAFIAATDPGCKKEFIGFGSLGLLKYIIESKLEDRLPNIITLLRIFLTSAISNPSCERSFSKLKLIKSYL
ncbi:uncharacterized protein TNCV_2178701 [Trichonephila clavipes]|uniref:HAT C-terminal dimerisation domain-containing protein n=1 Tax=Trichonephila clavipes TaxID=2585209 RepID=A0A8X7B8Y1_TRICX|nr:uncharacterized protein TNCV_2178701 [Trichonephila clavipes]